MIQSSIAKAVKIIRTDGTAAFAELILRRLGSRVFGSRRIHFWLVSLTDRWYDSMNRVDTGGVVNPPEAEEHGGRNYVATAPRIWRLLMGHLPPEVRPSAFTYIDLGCGKGRTLFMAAQHGFRRVIGVDCSLALIEVARRNAASLQLDCELVCQDVTEFCFPNDPLVIFLYNPFYADVMRRVSHNLKTSAAVSPRDIYVVYYNPAFAEAWRDCYSIVAGCDALYPCYAIYKA